VRAAGALAKGRMFDMPGLQDYTTRLTARPLALLCGAWNFGKIWPACGQHDI
jgi:hypothetical protein